MNLFLLVVDQMAPWCFGWLGKFSVHRERYYTLPYSPAGDILYFQLLSTWCTSIDKVGEGKEEKSPNYVSSNYSIQEIWKIAFFKAIFL